MDVNKVLLIGRLGRDPERRTENIVSLALATSKYSINKQTKERTEQTEWHNVTLFDKYADIAMEYLRKGSEVRIEGEIRTRKYTAKDGSERYVTEIAADYMRMGKRPESTSSAPKADSKPIPKASSGHAPTNIPDEDIPF